MTAVTFEDLGGGCTFQCIGHTGYAEAGRDILCSAVSCLCYTLDAFVSKKAEQGEIINYYSDFSSGNVRIGFELPDRWDSRGVMEGINAILCGFELLFESFPQHITLDIC